MSKIKGKSRSDFERICASFNGPLSTRVRFHQPEVAIPS